MTRQINGISEGDIVVVDTGIDDIGERRATIVLVHSSGDKFTLKYLNSVMGLEHEMSARWVRKASLLELLIEEEPVKARPR